MKVAVTGGSGRIGSELVRQLAERGHDVLALDIRPPEETSIPHRVLDLRAQSAVRSAFDGMDAVCHLGEIPGLGGRDPSDVYAHNTQVGSLVMEVATQLGIPKFIYTSTCQVYGAWGQPGMIAPRVLPIDENHPLLPQNAYALSKTANEGFARIVTQTHPIAIAAFRFPGVAGDGDFRWMANPARKTKLHSRRDGLATYVHRQDAAAAYCLALEKGWTGFEAYHFFAEDILYDGTIQEVLAEQYPHLRMPDNWPGHRSPVSTAKALEHFGWRAERSHREEYLSNLRAYAKAV